MSIVLFAMIGAAIKAGAWYWIIFGIFCANWLLTTIGKIIIEINK